MPPMRDSKSFLQVGGVLEIAALVHDAELADAALGELLELVLVLEGVGPPEPADAGLELFGDIFGILQVALEVNDPEGPPTRLWANCWSSRSSLKSWAQP
jgi:hypothetical protein